VAGGKTAADLDAWLASLGLEPMARSERDGVSSRDLVLHGRRRRRIRLTLILEPALALLLWVHYAPPLNDGFRRTYQRLLRWNDELPFVKFALGLDERLVLTTEIPTAQLGRDALGLAVARLVAVCDLLVDESATWIWPLGHQPPPEPDERPSTLLDAYAAVLGELAAPPGASA
jgi:hypothetical protein